jgi:hypothetical protein
MATQAIPPPPRCGIPPVNWQNLAESPVPHMAGFPEVAKLTPEVANRSPECHQCDAKGSHVTSGVLGEKTAFPRQFLN